MVIIFTLQSYNEWDLFNKNLYLCTDILLHKLVYGGFQEIVWWWLRQEVNEPGFWTLDINWEQRVWSVRWTIV